MPKTSFHLEPCDLINSESHNRRTRKFDHVRTDLTPLNESLMLIDYSLQKELANIRREVKAKTKRKLQSNAIPIKEGVIVIKEDTTIEDVRRFCDACEKRWGIIPLHIHIHKDEGHWKGKEWIPNLHAHIVWRMYNREGRNCRIRDTDCAEMQDIAAQVLGMERGKPSTKKHLQSLEYKIKQLEQHIEDMQYELTDLRQERADVTKQVVELKSKADKLAKENEERTRKNAESEVKSRWQLRLTEISDTAKGILERFSDLDNKKRAENAEKSKEAAEKRLEEVERGKLAYRQQVQEEAYDEILKERRRSQREIEESGDYKSKYEELRDSIESNKPYAQYWDNLSDIVEKSEQRGLNFSIGEMMRLAEGHPLQMDRLPTGERMEDIGEPSGIRIKWGRMARDFVLAMKRHGQEVWRKFDDWRVSFNTAKERLDQSRSEKKTEEKQERRTRGIAR